MCYFLFKLLQYLLCNSFFIFAILQKYRLNSNGLPVGLSFEFLTIQIVQYSLKLHSLHSIKSLSRIVRKRFTSSD